jgi:hypothetical protein
MSHHDNSTATPTAASASGTITYSTAVSASPASDVGGPEPAHLGGWTMDLDPSSPCEVIVRGAGDTSEMRLIYEPDDAAAMTERLVRVTGMASGEARQLVAQLPAKLWGSPPPLMSPAPAKLIGALGPGQCVGRALPQIRGRYQNRPHAESDDCGAFVRRVVAAYGCRIAAGDVERRRELVVLADELDRATKVAVAGLRRAGYSLAEIASRFGITRQAAQQRRRDAAIG